MAGDKLGTAERSLQKVAAEAKPNKVTKRSKERKQFKGLDADAVLESVAGSPEDENAQDSKEKKLQGIVIDGKTYTCATCKAGHRVGICKHARERPMTATHPPGRPSAGAPKKIVCDCPKECSCKKRGCKCARKCNCTQMMYMLVYVPAPGEESQEMEQGTWKLGHPVTTDLKGNILTPDQVKERREQKQAQRTQTPEKHRTTIPQSNVLDSTTSTTSLLEAKPEAIGGCCKHKENVATRNTAAETSSQIEKVLKPTADGCNCGNACICAFCPQHPNNSTSQNMAREQAVHFANHSYSDENQSIMPMMPSVSQEASCMGGLPQFAMSRYAEMPSYHDLQRAFPNPGYVIGYPIWSTRTDSAGFPVTPFPTQPSIVPHMNMVPIGEVNNIQPPVAATHSAMGPHETPVLDYSQDEFGIGNAFVASAGIGGWDPQYMSPTTWPTETTVQTPALQDFVDVPEFYGRPTPHTELQSFTPVHHDADLDFNSHINVPRASFSYGQGAPAGAASFNPSLTTMAQKSCCDTPYEGSALFVEQAVPPDYHYPRQDNTSIAER